MKLAFLGLSAAILATGMSLRARSSAPPTPPAAATPAPAAALPAFETLPILNASTILQPPFFQGPNFLVRNPVPTYAGSNHYTIDSDFGIFEADGNAMLMRRVAEIKGIAALNAMSQTTEFTQAASQAVAAPLNVAQDLITDPVPTLSSVPRGIWGFLNRAGQTVQNVAEGHGGGIGQGQILSNVSGFSKTKRALAIKLGVDPYSKNEIFQKALNKVAWPAAAGKFTVDLGLAAVGGEAGTVLSGLNLTANLQESLRDQNPSELRQMNYGVLTNEMDIANGAANAFLNNPAISPTTQTLLVAALAQLGNIPGQGEFILQAADSQDEHDALAFLQSVQLMAKLTQTAPVTRIAHIGGLTLCQTNDGTVIVPIQWDYMAWTEGVSQFITALKAHKFPAPATGYTIMLTGVVSPTANQALTASGVNIIPQALPGPLQ